MGIKRLFFDIETSPNVGLFWSAGYRQNIGYESIVKERAIICIAYKWAGEKTVHALYWDKNQNDKTMLKEFMKVVNQADELITHNGDKFDLPWIRTRCLFHGIEMFPTYTTLDTLVQARNKFRFNSNRIDYIAKFLGLGAKIHTNYDMWKKIVLENNQRSLQEMVRYCKGDVSLLEKVYDKLSPHLPTKTHHGVVAGQPKFSCPHDGSTNMRYVRTRITATGIKRYVLQCKDCGKYHTVSEKVYKDFLKHGNKSKKPN